MKTATKTRKPATSAKTTKPHGKKNPKVVAPATPKIIDVLALPKKSDPKPCWCGCKNTTKNKFCPGHDARFHGWAKKCSRGEMNTDETMEGLAHQDARDEFAKCVEHERKEMAKAKK